MKTLSDIDGSLAKKVAARRGDDEHTYEWLYHDVLGDVSAVVDGLVADKCVLCAIGSALAACCCSK